MSYKHENFSIECIPSEIGLVVGNALSNFVARNDANFYVVSVIVSPKKHNDYPRWYGVEISATAQDKIEGWG